MMSDMNGNGLANDMLGRSVMSMAATQSSSLNSRRNSNLAPRRNTNTSYDNITAPVSRTEAKVLVIYTGGTIGMMRNAKNGECNKIPANELYLFAATEMCLIK